MKKRIKLIVIYSLLLVVTFLFSSRQFSSEAKGDAVLEEIAKYKSWTRVSKEPLKVELTIDGADG